MTALVRTENRSKNLAFEKIYRWTGVVACVVQIKALGFEINGIGGLHVEVEIILQLPAQQIPLSILHQFANQMKPILQALFARVDDEMIKVGLIVVFLSKFFI